MMRRPGLSFRIATLIALILTLTILSACGGAGKKKTTDEGERPSFQCRDRHLQYMVAGGMSGAEASVIMDCAEAGPRLRTWRLLNDAGDRNQTSHSLSTNDFDALWDKVDSTGWRNLSGDCANPEASPADPIYTIAVQLDDLSVEMSCTGRTLPFPYNTFVDELDLLAAAQR